MLIKLAPDLTDNELYDALGVILYQGMDGLIATNTTPVRKGLRSAQGIKSGRLSGSPLKVLSETQLEKIIRRVGGPTLFTAWGIASPANAKRRLDMEAALIKVYTGLIYRSPGLVREIVQSLLAAS